MRIGWNAQDDVDADEKHDHAGSACCDTAYEACSSLSVCHGMTAEEVVAAA